MNTFCNDNEKLEFLKKYNILSKTAAKLPMFYHFAVGSTIPDKCEIIGYEDEFSTWAVITIQCNGQIINIHSSHFKDMQESSTAYFKNNKVIDEKNSYVVFDLETTGTNYKRNEIIEIAAIKVTPTDIFEFNELVKIDNIIPLDITALTGITNEMIYNADTIDIVLPKFLDFIGDCILVGHNIKAFDCYFINKYCEVLNLPRLNNEIIDTVYLSKQTLPNLENHKLSTLCEYYGIDSSNAHRALSDCYMCNSIYTKLLTNNQQEVSEIVDLSSTTDSFQQNIVSLLNKLIVEKELPENSLRLRKNKKTLSVCINEPPYPLGTVKLGGEQSLFKIEELASKEIIQIDLLKSTYDNIPSPLPSIDYKLVKVRKNEPQHIVLYFPANHAQLYDFIRNVIVYRIDNYSTAESSFGCCSKFNQCSDLKKCIHENKLYATACIYRKRLENNNIFYGKNRNIE